MKSSDYAFNRRSFLFINKIVLIKVVPIQLVPKVYIGFISIKKSFYLKEGKIQRKTNYKLCKSFEYKDFEKINRLKHYIDLTRGDLNYYFELYNGDKKIRSVKNTIYEWSDKYVCFKGENNELVIYDYINDTINSFKIGNGHIYEMNIINEMLIIYTDERNFIYNIEEGKEECEIRSRYNEYDNKIAFYDTDYIYEFNTEKNEILKIKNIFKSKIKLIYDDKGILYLYIKKDLYKTNFTENRIERIALLPLNVKVFIVNDHIYYKIDENLKKVNKDKETEILNNINIVFSFESDYYFVCKNEIYFFYKDRVKKLVSFKHNIITQFLYERFGNYKIFLLENNQIYILYNQKITKI